MRIVAGKLRGRNLLDSNKYSFRPTTDKNREALFNIILLGKKIKDFGFEIQNANILDVCCGSGAVSFEAISRGASFATLIDNSKDHLDLAKKNAQSLKILENCDFIFCDVKKNLPKNDKNFDLVFIDPPYEEDYQEIILNLKKYNYLNKNSLIVIEAPSDKNTIEKLEFLKILDSRKYGISKFIFCHLN